VRVAGEQRQQNFHRYVHVSEFFPAKPVLHTEARQAREPIDAASALSHARIRRL